MSKAVSGPELSIKRFLISVFFFAVFQIFAYGSLAQAAIEAKWNQVSDDDGIRVFTKEIPGNPVIALRGEGVVEASLPKLAGILLDGDRATEWIDSLVESKNLKLPSETEYLRYSHLGTPIMMKDREFVTEGKVVTDLATKTFALKIKSVESPLAPKTDYVRGQILDSSFTVKALSGNRSMVIVEFHADPKGSVAKWIVNMFQKKWPRNTLTALRKQAAKSDVQEDLHYKKVFAGGSQ